MFIFSLPPSLFPQGANTSIRQISGEINHNSKEIEVPKHPLPHEKPSLKSSLKPELSQTLPAKEAQVKGTHVQLDHKDKPTTPGEGLLH